MPPLFLSPGHWRWSDASRTGYLETKTKVPAHARLSRRPRNRGMAGLTTYIGCPKKFVLLLTVIHVFCCRQKNLWGCSHLQESALIFLLSQKILADSNNNVYVPCMLRNEILRGGEGTISHFEYVRFLPQSFGAEAVLSFHVRSQGRSFPTNCASAHLLKSPV